MSSSANPQHEPTMEEILASIRKIISEDQPDATKTPAPSARSAPVEPAPAPQAEADVLELTEEVHEEEAVASLPEPEPPIENDIAFETIDEPKAEPDMDPDDLISDTTRTAMGRAFANLDTDDSRSHSASGGGTLDALFVRAIQDAFVPTLKEWVDDHHPEIMDNLKPVIREWMDDHLPRLIEAAVTKEIARAAAQRPRRR
jgi:cell pole-organizing protein PopZ